MRVDDVGDLPTAIIVYVSQVGAHLRRGCAPQMCGAHLRRTSATVFEMPEMDPLRTGQTAAELR